MNTFKVTEETFDEIHAATEMGDDSSKICKDFGLRLPAVKIALKYHSFEEYEEHFNVEETEPEEVVPEVKQDTQISKPEVTRVVSTAVESNDEIAVNVNGMMQKVGSITDKLHGAVNLIDFSKELDWSDSENLKHYLSFNKVYCDLAKTRIMHSRIGNALGLGQQKKDGNS